MGNDARQIALGRGQQIIALARPLPGELEIAADDQPFAGIIGRGDLRQIALVEQRELQRPVSVNAWICGARSGDPVQPGRLEILADTGAGDHAAVADQYHVLETEALFQLADLRGQSARVPDIALEHLDRDRPAITVTEQAVDDLQPIRPTITAIPVPGELRTERQLLSAQRRLYQPNAAWFLYFCPFPAMMRFVGVRGIAHDRTGSRDFSEAHNGE